MDRQWTIITCLTSLLCFGSVGRAAPPARNFARELGNSIADVVDHVMPSVVVIRTEATVYHAARDIFFGNVYGIPEHLLGQGSGVIISKDGYVLTSNHVIQDAEHIEVVLHNGEKYTARKVGQDPLTDVAVLKIESKKRKEFTPIVPGDSDKLRVGEFVVAVGSPFSLDSSVTLGIVSQKGRNVGVLPYEDFIQTDASINPGNSGGPLVDVDGRMVGLNAVIQTGSPYVRTSIGIGFAVPVNVAMRVAESLIKTGTVERPWVGIQLREVVRSGDADANEDGPTGVLAGDIVDNTPAAKAGLKEGDLITAVDGTGVSDVHAVQRLILKHRVGETVKLDIRRGEERKVFEVICDRMPDFSRIPR